MMQQWLSRQEAAAVLGLTVAEVDRLIATGLLPRYRLRERYVRVRKEDVDQLADVPIEWLLRC
jgi:excisionase family DNA binding protein